MRKYFISLMLTSAVALNTTTMIFAETNNINITIDNEVVEFTDAKPYVDSNGRTMVPVSKIGELLGVQVGWNNDIQTVTLKDGDNKVSLKINDDNITVNGVTTKMDTKAVIKNGRTYVPVSAIAKAFGVSTGWDKDTNTVSLKSQEKDNVKTNQDQQTKVETENTVNTVNTDESIVLTAKLNIESADILDTVEYSYSANELLTVYTITAKTEYFNANNFTVLDWKQKADEIEKKPNTNNTMFESEDFYGSVGSRPSERGISNKTIPQKHRELGDYTIKIFGVTEDGRFSNVIDLEFTLEPRITAELVEITDMITFEVISTQIINHYFVIGESEAFEGVATVDELKEMVDNVQKNNGGFFDNGKFFGRFTDKYVSLTKTGIQIPEERKNGKEYTAKIFGVTENGEISEMTSLKFVLE